MEYVGRDLRKELRRQKNQQRQRRRRQKQQQRRQRQQQRQQLPLLWPGASFSESPPANVAVSATSEASLQHWLAESGRRS
ncbi:hypothetical protein CLOP_g22274 [Closterium sp. NIES-67]|nr:hypothetical protein CLOP_g22274 [Closterium sp. NIES-67]